MNEENLRTEETNDLPPLAQNGYVPKERKIITVLCVIFLVLLCIFRGSQLGGYLGRDRNLTVENYADYLQIRVMPQTNTNPKDYDILITAKKTISTAEIQLNVLYFYDLIEIEELPREAHIKIDGGLPKGETYTYSVHFETIVFCNRVQVVEITGRLP